MLDRAELTALAHEVMERDGPCHNTDERICQKLGIQPALRYCDTPARSSPFMLQDYPALTGSLDAAASVIPEGWILYEILAMKNGYQVYIDNDIKPIKATAKTLINALLAAALLALAEEV